jgi:hypothetical protein
LDIAACAGGVRWFYYFPQQAEQHLVPRVYILGVMFKPGSFEVLDYVVVSVGEFF